MDQRAEPLEAIQWSYLSVGLRFAARQNFHPSVRLTPASLRF
jgi:hypothetical protein